MQPLPPTVSLPLSPCSFAVELRGLIAGATVEVLDINDKQLASGVAQGAIQAFPLNQGVSLEPRSKVRAFQTFDGERSPNPDDLAMAQVMSAPKGESDIGGLVWATGIFQCGRCVFLTGAYPGALVEVRNNMGQVIGSGRVIGTEARIGLTKSIGANVNLEARQEACGIQGYSSASPPANPLPHPLLPPTIVEPLVQCDRRITIIDVLEGAEIGVARQPAGDHIQACFDLPQLYIPLSEAARLRGGEALTAKMLFQDCDSGSVSSDKASVNPLTELPTPVIATPLCANGQRLALKRLHPEALIVILVNGQEKYQAGASGSSDTLNLPLLPPQSKVRVYQKLCGVRSGLSNEVEVDSPAAPPSPGIDPLPYECATLVRVVRVRPGATVMLYSGRRGLLNSDTAWGNEIILRVPSLTKSDNLYVTQTYCGISIPKPGSSQPYPVQPLFPGSVGTPQVIGTLLAGDRVVQINNVAPGAVVEVTVRNVYRGAAEIAGESGKVPVTWGLKEDDLVQVRQRICDRISDYSKPPVQVQSCRGRIRVGLKVLNKSWQENLHNLAITMRNLYRQFGLDVVIVDEEILDLPHLQSIPDGGCRRGKPSAEFKELHQNRNNLGSRDVAVFMIDSISEGAAGCSAFDGLPACVVGHLCGSWAVAHEVGHVVGQLEHTDQNGKDLPSDNLMYGDVRIGFGPNSVKIEDWQKQAMINGPYTDRC